MTNPLPLYIAIIGWLIVLLLNNRTLKRSEISRIKDRLIDKLDSCISWLDSEINSDAFEPSLAEVQLSGKATLIELKVRQLNHYVGTELLPVSEISNIRALDVFQPNKAELLVEATETISDLIEKVEIRYDEFYFSTPLPKRLWMSHRQTMMGAFLSLLLIIAFLTSTRLMIE
ncbi:hypothetical protein [Marinobacterium stanieri]|uniref:Uncharacterized protein n=1 Tax=Marinobacterium stanieri TaxID=49186 RepID=A0A1N6QCS9_9GAMM|nr:hypothetical protein [Marinobacterium stanieri]SIQ14358.1 hypothetical protein SAMN05421647_102420 [Marinobacterium stanieri]